MLFSLSISVVDVVAVWLLGVAAAVVAAAVGIAVEAGGGRY